MYTKFWYELFDTFFRRWNIYKMPWRQYNTTQWWTCSACWELMSTTSYKVRLRIKLFLFKQIETICEACLRYTDKLYDGSSKVGFYCWDNICLNTTKFSLCTKLLNLFSLNYHVLTISFSDAEVTALRAKIHEMRESSMSMEQDCRERVKEEYRDLIKNLLEASGVVKNKLDEFR